MYSYCAFTEFIDLYHLTLFWKQPQESYSSDRGEIWGSEKSHSYKEEKMNSDPKL